MTEDAQVFNLACAFFISDSKKTNLLFALTITTFAYQVWSKTQKHFDRET